MDQFDVVVIGAGLSQNREWIVGVEEVYDSRRVKSASYLHCFLAPELTPGYIAWIAHDGEEMHVGVGGYGNRFDPNVLTRYENALFRKRHRSRVRMRRGLAGLRSSWMAELGFAALRLPPFKSIARQIFFGRGSFPIEQAELESVAGFRAV